MNSQQDSFVHKEYRLCECIGHSVHNNEVFSLDFSWQGPAPKAGQFFLLRPERSSVFLARPLSVALWTLQGNSRLDGLVQASESGILRFVIAIRGKGTQELANFIQGEKAYLTGPLGRGWAEAANFQLDDFQSLDLQSGESRPGKIALVSGGVGIAPLACFAQEFSATGSGLPESQDFNFYAGFRSKSYGLENIKANKLIIASEDGCDGHKGYITDFFTPDNYSAVFSCGPEPMLKSIAEKCRAAAVKCFVSLERHMACGTGACLGCTVETKNNNKRCCSDGPVFDAEDIFV